MPHALAVSAPQFVELLLNDVMQSRVEQQLGFATFPESSFDRISESKLESVMPAGAWETEVPATKEYPGPVDVPGFHGQQMSVISALILTSNRLSSDSRISIRWHFVQRA